MGQQESSKSSAIIDHNWIPVKPDHTALFNNVNPFAKRTLRNQFTNEQVEQYELEFASEEDYRNYTEELRVRIQPSNKQMLGEHQPENYFNCSPYIFTVKYFVNHSMQDMCSTFYKGMLYAEKVDLRLKQINDIPLCDQLYLVRATLQGFKLLYERVGYFDITEEMIFISKMGRAKVWINPNISKNNPYFTPTNSFRDPHGSQSHMIVKLIDIIEDNTDGQHPETVHFRQYLTNKNVYDRLSFYKALEEFEAYCMEEHLTPQESMRSIYELYYQDHNDQPQKSEVLQMSMHRDGGNLMGLRRNQRDLVSPQRDSITSPIYKDNFSVFSPNVPQREDVHRLTGSKVSKTSRRSESHNVFIHHPQQKQEHIHLSILASENNRQRTPCFGSNPTTVPALHIRGSSVNRYYSHQIPAPNYPAPPRRQLFPQQLSIRVASQPTVSTGRNTSVSKNNHEAVSDKIHYPPLDKSQHAVVRFNYNNNLPPVAPPKPVQTILPRPIVQQVPRGLLPTNLVTIQTINSSHGDSVKQVNHFVHAPNGQLSSPPQLQLQKPKEKQKHSTVSYYSTNQMYTLDRQIADDLQKYLGYPLS